MGDTLQDIFDIDKQLTNGAKLVAIINENKEAIIAFNKEIGKYQKNGAAADAKELIQANRELALQQKELNLEITKKKELDRQAALERKKQLDDEKQAILEKKELDRQAAADKKKQIQDEKQASLDAVNAQRLKNTELAEQKKREAELAVFESKRVESERQYMASMIKTTQANKDKSDVVKKSAFEELKAAELKKQLEMQAALQLKNTVKEELATKGSIEQRRAALIRLTASYDQLSAVERNSAQGQRLQGVVTGLTNQVKELESVTGRSQRNVGNYGSAFTNALGSAWGAVRKLAYALPGVGIAGIIGFAVDPIYNYVKSLFSANKETQKLIDNEKGLEDVLSGANSQYVKAVTEVNNLRIAFDQAKNGIITKEEALKLYNETIGKTTGEVNNLDEAEKALAKNAESYIQFTLLKAAANVALEKSAQKAFEIESNSRKKFVNEQDATDIFGNKFSQERLDKMAAERAAAFAAGIRGSNDKLEEEKNNFTEIAKDFQKQAEDLAKKMKFDFNAIKEPDEKNKKAKKVKEELDYEYEGWKIQQNRLASNFKDMSMDEKKSLDDRVQMLGGYLNVQEALINRELEQKNKGANKEQQKLNQAKANDDLIALEYKYYEDLAKIYNTAHKDEKKAFEVLQGDIRKATQKASDDLAKIQKKEYDDEIEREKKRAQEIKDIRKRLEDELMKTAAAFIDGGFERQKNAIEDQKTLLDQQTKDEIDRINASTLSAQDKADKITAIQATALANKTALDAKEKEIERKKATFDRGVAIAEIIANVARAVSKDLLGNKGMIPFDIAIGAAQIAAILAHPIPKFKHGGTMAKDGMAMVGDGYKTEAMITPDGNVSLTPDKPTLTYIKAGTKIIGGDELDKVRMAINPIGQLVERKEKDNTLRDELRYQTTELIKVLKKQKGTNVRVYNDSKFNAFIQKSVRD